jgi:acetylornithine deacetylase
MERSELETRIHNWIQTNKQPAIDLVSDLIRYDSVNHVVTGGEKACNVHVANVLIDTGLLIDMYTPDDVKELREHPAYFPGKDYSGRPNVIGIWKGSGEGKSLLFSSHIDTTVAAKEWQIDPWTPLMKENKLYGLGSFDMKGGLAASIMAVRCLRELGIRMKGDIMIESVVDEEFGGANGALAGRVRGYHADAAIIPEPTNFAVCPATRGGALWRVTFTGKSGMSFSGEKIVNPGNLAAKFIVFLEEYEAARATQPGPSPWYEDDSSVLPVMVTRIEAGDMNAVLCDSGPAECYVDIWVECYPGVSEEQLKKELLDGFHSKYGLEAGEPLFEKVIRFLPGAEIPPDFPLIRQLAQEMEAVTGRTAAIHGAPFACDAFMFNLYSSTPAIVMGPVGANAHGADEYMDLDAFYDLIEIYARAAIRWCGMEDTV